MKNKRRHSKAVRLKSPLPSKIARAGHGVAVLPREDSTVRPHVARRATTADGPPAFQQASQPLGLAGYEVVAAVPYESSRLRS